MIDRKLREQLEEGLARGFALDLGIHFRELDEGYAELEMPMEDRKRNIYGMVHGGALYTLLDTASGFAVRSYGDRVVTLTGTANYLVAGKETAYLLAKAKVVRKGGHTAVVSADVFDDKGSLLANGSFNFYVLRY